MQQQRTALLALLGAGALALTGCSAGPADDGPTTITFWHGYTEADGDVLDQIVEDFNASQDDVEIRTEVRTWDSIDDTLLPALSAGEGPQIVAMPAERMPVYADRGAFVDLTDLYAESDALATLSEPVVDMVTLGEEQFAVPTGFVPLSVFYNKALFAEAGIEAFPETWDEWVEVAERLTVDENGDGTPEQYGLTVPDHGSFLWPSLFLSGGGDIVEDGASVVDSSENLQTLEYWTAAVRDGKISPTGLDGIAADELYSAGQAAMHLGGPWLATISEENGIDYGIAAIPAGPSEQAATAIGVAMGITAEAEDAQIAGAQAFFEYFLSEDVATEWSLASGWPPLRSDIPVEAVSSNPVVAALTEIAATGRPLLPGVVATTDVITAVDNLTQRAVAGQDPEALLGEAQAAIDAALAD